MWMLHPTSGRAGGGIPPPPTAEDGKQQQQQNPLINMQIPAVEPLVHSSVSSSGGNAGKASVDANVSLDLLWQPVGEEEDSTAEDAIGEAKKKKRTAHKSKQEKMLHRSSGREGFETVKPPKGEKEKKKKNKEGK